MNGTKLDILLPTYNRATDLAKNLKLLDEQANKLNGKPIKIIISNNASTDDTFTYLEDLKTEKLSFELEIYHQPTNIGLEPNAIFLLSKSKSNFIMYLGDDDFLPNGYLDFVISTIRTDQELGSIIPGFSALYKDGTVHESRNACFDVKKYDKGFNSLLKISHFGHQLSGLVSKREGLLESYLAMEDCRNIYPFIFFISKPIKELNSYYAPKYQVLVSQENVKDWNYDESGLLTEVFKNYKLLYPNAALKRLLLELSFSTNQSWRLRAGRNLKNAGQAFLHLAKSKNVDVMFKLALPALYVLCYVKKIDKLIKRAA